MLPPGALQATDLRYVEPGVFVWSKTRGHEGVHDDGTQIDPIGGLVVDVVDDKDPETGEIERTFVVVDTWRGQLRLRRLPESDVDRTTMEAADSSAITLALRQLCEEVAIDSRRRLRRGIFRPDHKTLLHYAWRLGELL